MSWPFDNSYARLPDRLFTPQAPTPVRNPQIIAVNAGLARELGLDPAALSPDILAGNTLPDGAAPLAQLYAGHQFGNWVPQLGDGRAVLLGEVIGQNGRRDIQLKGAGRTPYSRNGDGRAWLGPILREYVVSEAMHALGVPTTRALAAVTTGEKVQREQAFPGAILTRVAASHIRVGTFQALAARGDTEALEALTAHVIARHYPDVDTPLELLRAIVSAQAGLIAKWMSIGFIHGVMNTDNMAVSGETIDYGPCAFMDAYHPATLFSSIDQFGRYAYQQQPDIAVWNLAQLATSLLPLMGEREAAVEAATEAVNGFSQLYQADWMRLFRAKLGLKTQEEGDLALITGLLQRMATSQADFTNTFRALADGAAAAHITDEGAWDSWAPDWQARLAREPGDPQATMRNTNPAFIPRNHRIEQAIQAGLTGDFALFHRLNTVLAHPFENQPDQGDLALPPENHERVLQTFCGT
ncbi:protein adenylyltransferase SelO [Aliiroseovarius subalbicans]|uniref:protein adenylyltransferase SelO n=1 Tax=Aliiroseovarius subalbicans TaxID=2925840 RepID=UPI001F594A85|nr:YdiU family protein [Aliiroseovarius subalbicans]MCI2398761.1 YdiU family protein [Aliiroseovarius subalbicans]